MQQPSSQPGRSQFNLATMSTASKILLAGGVLYLINLFLPWRRACFGVVGVANVCGSQNGLSHIFIFSFVGLILAVVVAYGGWMRWQESKVAPGTLPPPGPPGPAGGSSFSG